MSDKVLSREELADLIPRLEAQGRSVVFTNGCFDLLHVGHVRYLKEAKELGDILIVGVNSDSSARKLKGNGKPLIPENERAEVLSALECVDFVTIFEEETPEALLRLLKPDWHVKGGDYAREDLPEAKVVESYGGRVKTLSLVPGRSTTSLIEKIKNAGRS